MKDLSYYFSIDVGGTDIKGGIVSSAGEILTSAKFGTKPNAVAFDLAESIMALCDKLEKLSGYKLSDALGLGVGLPGLIDSKRGVLRHSGNLRLTNYPVKSKLEKFTKVPIKIGNDADIATLAELHFGAGKKYQNFLLISIGTGIGGGAVIGGKPISEFCNYSSEFGHMKVTDEKIVCTCGSYGCFEAVASSRALNIQIKDKLRVKQNSKMLKDYSVNEVDGKILFEYIGKDKVANEIFDEYIKKLGNGIVNLANIFSPDAIVLSGAISAQKNKLIKPLEDYVNKNIYARNAGKSIKFLVAKETGNAGILGGMCLFLSN